MSRRSWVIRSANGALPTSAVKMAQQNRPASRSCCRSHGRCKDRRPADEAYQLYLPRETFYNVATLLDAACADHLQMSGGRLLADYMRLLRKCAELGRQ